MGMRFVALVMEKSPPFIICFNSLSGVKKKGYGFYDSKTRRKMKKLTIYIARYKASTQNISGHSAPCSNFLCKIRQLGIKKLVYADATGQIKKCLVNKFSTDYISVGYREYARQNIKVY